MKIWRRVLYPGVREFDWRAESVLLHVQYPRPLKLSFCNPALARRFIPLWNRRDCGSLHVLDALEIPCQLTVGRTIFTGDT
jgi:hypothetical protein